MATRGANTCLGTLTEALDESIYNRLRARAEVILRREGRDHKLEADDLLHEAFVRIARSVEPICFQDETHLLAVVTLTMRRILIDQYRSASSPRKFTSVPLDNALAQTEPSRESIPVRDVLRRLAAADPKRYRVVEMRIFWGLGVEEIASMLSISSRTVKRDWVVARIWLQRELEGGAVPLPSAQADIPQAMVPRNSTRKAA
ncbi:MAG TPA: ECF-type sigma factor [Bryobacteraceae bacterium]|nr:ECF-type sigma factor [Bryobacteraceae bacterium]